MAGFRRRVSDVMSKVGAKFTDRRVRSRSFGEHELVWIGGGEEWGVTDIYYRANLLPTGTVPLASFVSLIMVHSLPYET